MIIQYLQNAGSSGAKRDAIFEYLKEVLPQNKTQEQQERMIGNILSEMKEIGLIRPAQPFCTASILFSVDFSPTLQRADNQLYIKICRFHIDNTIT